MEPLSVVERPATEVELVAIVAQAAALHRPVRVGQPTRTRHRRGREVLIDLSGYRRPLRIDRDRGRATFEAGVPLGLVDDTLGSWGLSRENGGRDPSQSLGAGVSLGAHGRGASFGGLATQVTGLRLITPAGEVLDCSATEEPEIFDAARIGLGALGVISTVTLRCLPGFNLRSRTMSVPLDEAVEHFDEYAAANQYFELSWLPARARARVMVANRTEEAPDGRAVGRGYRWWNRRRLPPPPLGYAFAREDFARAARRARELTASRRGGLLFPIEVTVSAGDALPMSPTQGCASVWIAGVAGLDGRPQWGGPHGLSEAALRARYPLWDEWQAVRARLDPDRAFAHNNGQG